MQASSLFGGSRWSRSHRRIRFAWKEGEESSACSRPVGGQAQGLGSRVARGGLIAQIDHAAFPLRPAAPCLLSWPAWSIERRVRVELVCVGRPVGQCEASHLRPSDLTDAEMEGSLAPHAWAEQLADSSSAGAPGRCLTAGRAGTSHRGPDQNRHPTPGAPAYNACHCLLNFTLRRSSAELKLGGQVSTSLPSIPSSNGHLPTPGLPVPPAQRNLNRNPPTPQHPARENIHHKWKSILSRGTSGQCAWLPAASPHPTV